MDQFDKSLPMMLHRTLDTIIPLYRNVFKEHGITEQQWRVLRVLWELDECTSAKLASKTLLPNPSLVGIIDRMTIKGLVNRKRSKKDRRTVNISLTNEGKALEDKIMPYIKEVYAQIMTTCNESEWHTMMKNLQNIIDSQNPVKNNNANMRQSHG